MIIEITYELSESFNNIKTTESLNAITSGSEPRNDNEERYKFPPFIDWNTSKTHHFITGSISSSHYPIHVNYHPLVTARVIEKYETAIYNDMPDPSVNWTVKVVSQSLIES